jgi:hypothetical protein
MQGEACMIGMFLLIFVKLTLADIVGNRYMHLLILEALHLKKIFACGAHFKWRFAP